MSISTDNTTIGERIRSLRLKKKLQAADLAGQVHVTKQAWSHYEYNRRTPALPVLVCIARMLSVSLDYLAWRTDIPYNPDDEDFVNLMKAFVDLKPEDRKKLVKTAEELGKEQEKNDN